MNSPSPRLSTATPIRPGQPFPPAALHSLSLLKFPPEIALLDAFGDTRVTPATPESSPEFSYRRHGLGADQSGIIPETWNNTNAPVTGWTNAGNRMTAGTIGMVAASFATGREFTIFFGGSEFIDGSGTITGHHNQIKNANELLLRSTAISRPSSFARRERVAYVSRIASRLHYATAWEVWLCLCSASAKFRRYEAVLSQVFRGLGIKTNRFDPRKLGRVWRLLARHFIPIKAAVSTASVDLHPARERMSIHLGVWRV